MTLIIKYSLVYISGVFTGLISPILYLCIKEPKKILNEIIKN